MSAARASGRRLACVASAAAAAAVRRAGAVCSCPGRAPRRLGGRKARNRTSLNRCSYRLGRARVRSWPADGRRAGASEQQARPRRRRPGSTLQHRSAGDLRGADDVRGARRRAAISAELHDVAARRPERLEPAAEQACKPREPRGVVDPRDRARPPGARRFWRMPRAPLLAARAMRSRQQQADPRVRVGLRAPPLLACSRVRAARLAGALEATDAPGHLRAQTRAERPAASGRWDPLQGRFWHY